MAINSYIKDLTRYPVGFNRTLGGISKSVTYTTTTNWVAISDAINDGAGINQLKVFRSQFDTPAFTTPTSTTKLSDITLYYVANIANHTANNTKPYLFSELRGSESFYVSYVTGTAETCSIKTKAYKCCNWKWWKCKGSSSFGISSDYNACYNWTYFSDAQFTVNVVGGYGSTGHFHLRLFKGSTKIQEFVADEGTNVTFTGLEGSLNGRNTLGKYKLEVEDFITGQILIEYIYVPYCGEANFIVTQKTTTQTFPKSTLQTAGATNSIWILPTAVDSVPEGVILDSSIVSSTCTASTVSFSAILYPSTTPISSYQFNYRLDSTSPWVNVGTIGTVAANVPDIIVSATANINITVASVEWRLVASNTTGTTTFISTNNADLDVPEVFIDFSTQTIAAAAGPPKSITITTQTSSCQAYNVDALYWNATTFPTIETDLKTATGGGLPAGGTLISTKNITTTALTTNTWTLTPTTAGNRYVFVVRAQGTVAPFNTIVYPDSYFEAADPTDPTTVDTPFWQSIVAV